MISPTVNKFEIKKISLTEFSVRLFLIKVVFQGKLKAVIKMTFFRKLSRVVFFTALIFDIAVFGFIFYLKNDVSTSYKINKGECLNISSKIPVTAVYNGAKMSRSVYEHKVGDTFSVDLKMFGLIPFSNTEVEVVDEMYVAVLGNPFGMKIYTDGVLVIELSDVETENGIKNPAKDADIRVGDYVKSVNGKSITCNEDLSAVVMSSNGDSMKFEIIRDDKTVFCNVKAVKDKESGVYRAGIWVRDSSAGIGTLTFYSPQSDVVCGLGHGICDGDTSTLLSLQSGQLVNAQIVSVTKGDSGSPGELNGRLSFDNIADISLNADNGVYGLLKGNIGISTLTEVALKQEITDGNAQILCTVDGTTPKLYSCTVKKRNSAYLSKTQNLIVTVTDKELLDLTGGIVQGMSGSPILQNGRLIGAITHVLVDDPTTGYAIFAENMLETAQSVASENKLKDAS